MTDVLQLRGGRVVVTGAARGIGLETARAFAAHGARVVLNDIDAAALRGAVGELRDQGYDSVVAVAGDVRHAADVERLMRTVQTEFGGLDVMVSNAGIYPYREFLDMTEDEWNEVMDTNAKGAFLVCQGAARLMLETKATGQHCSIITISSGSHRFARIGTAHYCASKAAIVMLTRVMALELGRHNVTVNSIAPGLVDVDPGGATFAASYVDAMKAATPLGRIAGPLDVANVALFLASSLGQFVTGQVISVDGGLSAGRYAMPGQSN